MPDETKLPERKTLHHLMPAWVKDGSLFFITFCTEPRGRNQLCLPEVGSKLLESAAFYHEAHRWWLKILLLMPDHVHAMMAVPATESLSTIIRQWKSYQTKNLGIEWQSGFFDHRLRSDESEEAKTEYIRLNPVRAGLIRRADEWPYYWPR